MVALYYGVVPTKVRKTPRDLAQTSIYATLHQHRTLRCGGERRRRRVSGAFRTNHRRAMGELYQVKGDGPNQPGPDGAPVHRRQGVVHRWHMRESETRAEDSAWPRIVKRVLSHMRLFSPSGRRNRQERGCSGNRERLVRRLRQPAFR